MCWRVDIIVKDIVLQEEWFLMLGFDIKFNFTYFMLIKFDKILNKKILISILLICFVWNVKAQNDAYTLDEMKDAFVSQYVKHDPIPSLDKYDEVLFDTQFYTLYGTDQDSINIKRKLVEGKIFITDPSIRMVNKKLLPPSIFVWLYSKNSGKDMVYWIKFRNDNDSVTQTKMRNWLYDKIGTVTIENCKLVPAKWFSGHIMAIYPEISGNTIVSPRLFKADVVNGVVQETKYAYGEVTSERSSLKSDILRIQNGRTYVLDGHHDGYREERLALNLFARDVNRLCTIQKNAKIAEYSFLFFVDSERKTHLHVMLPSQIGAEDRLRIDELSKAIEAQPAQLFSRYFAIDGRKFSGLYVKAVFDSSGWNFAPIE